MIFIHKKHLLFAACFLPLFGCAQKEVIVQQESIHLESIAKSANDIHKELIQLSRLKGLSPHSYSPKKTPTTGPMSRKITLKWTGTAEEAVKTIATLISFDPPKIIGKRPANIKAVKINALDKPAFEILEDIGMQMGESAGLSISSTSIAIIYKGADQ